MQESSFKVDTVAEKMEVEEKVGKRNAVVQMEFFQVGTLFGLNISGGLIVRLHGITHRWKVK
jgi:hypothetical protein